MAADAQSQIEALKVELTKVKSRLAIYEPVSDSIETSGDTNPRNSKSAFRFLDLPRELRNTIYERCVVVGKVYIHHPGEVTTYDMRVTGSAAHAHAQTQLFQVCKQISTEARELYMGKNLFVLLAGPCIEAAKCRVPFSDFDKKFIRRLSISLDYRDYNGAVADDLLRHNTWETTRNRGGTIEDIRAAMCNVTINDLIYQIWYPLFREISNFKLDYLQINLQNCYCPLRCDRMVNRAFQRDFLVIFGLPGGEDIFTMLHELNPKVVDILGTLSRKERDDLYMLHGWQSIELQFHGGAEDGAGGEEYSLLDERKEAIDIPEGAAEDFKGNEDVHETGTDESLLELDDEELEDELNNGWEDIREQLSLGQPRHT